MHIPITSQSDNIVQMIEISVVCYRFRTSTFVGNHGGGGSQQSTTKTKVSLSSIYRHLLQIRSSSKCVRTYKSLAI